MICDMNSRTRVFCHSQKCVGLFFKLFYGRTMQENSRILTRESLL